MRGHHQGPPLASPQGSCQPPAPHPQPPSGSGAPLGLLLLLLLLLASWVSSCQGVPMISHVLREEQDLRLRNEIDDACSGYLVKDYQPQSSSALEELCFMVLGLLQKAQVFDQKDSIKRSSVLHPLLERVPHLHETRLKRYNMDEELQIPGEIQSRQIRPFVFRPRNGRRSSTFR